MSPEEINEAVEIAVQAIGPIPHPGVVIPITRYAYAYDYYAIHGPGGHNGWTYGEWNAYTVALMERLEQAGATVEMVDVRGLQYFAWLKDTGRPRDDESLADYTLAHWSAQTAQKPQ